MFDTFINLMYLDVFTLKTIIKDRVCRYHSPNTRNYSTAIDNYERIKQILLKSA